jgi:hypothetical protein
MFWHYITSPHLLVPLLPSPSSKKNTDKYVVVPFGHRCTSAIACKMAGLRSFSLPFDWINSGYPRKLHNVMRHNFIDFVILLAHVNKNRDEGVDQYNRRIQRFREVMQSDKLVIFVSIYEDYLYNQMHRDEEYHNDVFQGLIETEQFCKRIRNPPCLFIHIDFVERKVPKDSNIVQVIVKPDKLYDSFEESSYGGFREYCGQILQKVFDSSFSPYLDDSMFHD